MTNQRAEGIKPNELKERDINPEVKAVQNANAVANEKGSKVKEASREKVIKHPLLKGLLGGGVPDLAMTAGAAAVSFNELKKVGYNPLDPSTIANIANITSDPTALENYGKRSAITTVAMLGGRALTENIMIYKYEKATGKKLTMKQRLNYNAAGILVSPMINPYTVEGAKQLIKSTNPN